MDIALVDAVLDAIKDATEPLHQRIRALEEQVATLIAAPVQPSAPALDPQVVAEQVRERLRR